VRHYSRRTERAYVGWIRRYILFHRKRHPAEMGKDEASRFLSSLAVEGRVSASTQNQALQHERDRQAGAGWVELPGALARKYPDAGREWPWQWVFPATRTYTHAATGHHRRHHLHETVLQRAVHRAVRQAGISPPPAIPSGTRSPRISSRTATTSAQSKSFLAIATSGRR
jgi:Phage integrase, N-terminal SAM-like domain